MCQMDTQKGATSKPRGAWLTLALCATIVLASAAQTMAFPQINNQPSSVTACEDNAAAFTVSATSSNASSLSYQWRRGTTNLTDSLNISGATTATLVISPVGLADAATNYNVVVTDGQGSVTSDPATLTVNPRPAAPTGASASPAAICAGGTTTLSATVGGGETIDWYADACGGPVIGSGTGLLVGPLYASKTYYARARNTTTGCVSGLCTSVTVTVNANPTATISPDPAVICAGGSIALDGNPTGGSGSYTTHAWSGDTGPLSASNVQNPTFSTVTPGTYNLTYTVTDSNGCIGSDTLTVTVNPLPATPTGVQATPPTICEGESSTLSADSPGAGYSLEWFEDSCGGTPLTNLTVSPTATKTYYVRIKNDATGCVGTCESITVNVNPLPGSASNVAATPSIICAGESSILSADAPLSGYSLEWFEGSCGGTPVTNLTVSPTATTTYYVRVKNDATACVSACVSVTVTVNPLPGGPSNVQASPATICAGESSTLSADAPPSGYSLEWFEGSCAGAPVTNLTVSPTSTTTYFVRVKDDTTHCVSACESVTVTVNSLPAVPANVQASPIEICAGGNSTLSADAPPSGFSLEWFEGTCGGTPLGSLTVAPAGTTTYYVRTKNDTTGCVSACASVTVTVNPLPDVPSNAIATPATICAGSNSVLSADDPGTGYSLEWFEGTCGGTPVTNLTVSPALTTSYYVRVKYNASGCVSACVGPITVNVNQNPTASITPDPADVCADGSLLLDGNPAGGSGGYSHAWTGDVAYLSATNVQNPTFAYTGPALVQPAAPLTFNLVYTVTDSNGCQGSDTLTVTVNPLPSCAITAATQVSANSTGNVASVQNAGPGASYAWTISGGSITSGQGTPNLVFTAGTGASVSLGVTVTTAAGCTCSGSKVVPINSGPATLILAFDKDCYKPGDTVIATVSMAGLGTPAAGFQAFLSYNTTYLTFSSYSYTASPFGLHVLDTGALVNPSPGTIDLASGINQVLGQTPSNANALLATLTFQVPLNAPDACTASSLLTFRANVPPTRLTDAFANELAGLTLTPPQTVVVDGTPPDLGGSAANIGSCYPSVAAAQAAALAAVVANDNCTPTNELAIGVNTVGTCSAVVTVTVTDCAGNVSTKSYNTIIDNDIPVIDTVATAANLPAAVNVKCASQVPPTNVAGVVASDACPIGVTVSDSSTTPTCPNRYVITRTYTVTDTCGHTATWVQTITVDDDVPPSITAPGPVTVQCASAVPAHDFAGGSASDNCGTPVVTWAGDAISAQTCANRYTITRTYTATDACGNSASATQTITVHDDTKPVFTSVPGDITIQCDESTVPGILLGQATGGVAIYYNATGGEIPTNQAYLKTQFSATSTNGAAFTFDNTPLTGNGLVNWSGLFGQVGPPSQFGLDFVLQAPTSNGSVPTPVLNAYDNGNNSLAGRLLVGPVTWAINDYKDSAPNGPHNPANGIINSIIRGISPGVPVTDVQITKNVLTHPSANIWVVDIAGKLKSDSLIHWYNPVTPNSPMSNFNLNGDFYFSGTLTYDSSIDVNPLMDFYAGTITIVANSPNAALGFAKATDNCDLFPVVTYSDVETPGSCPNAKTITRTWKATDVCGNEQTAVQTITVVDTTPPTIVCPTDLTVSCASEVPAAAVDTAGFQGQGGTVSDNCAGAVTVTHVGDVIGGQTCPNRYTITRTYKAVDACNNEQTCAQTITVNDTTPPQITCPANKTIQCDESLDPNVNGALGVATATDNCPDAAPAIAYSDVSSILVNGSNLNGWSLFATQVLSNTPGGDGVAEFVNGPATPPMGSGSAHLNTGTNGSQSAQMRNGGHVGTRIADLTTLQYSTYVTAWNGSQVPYLTIWVDTNNDTIADDRLWFEPVYSAAGAGNGNPTPQPNVALNVWQTWDALDGMWYADSMFGPGSNARKLSVYLAAKPNATIVNAPGGVGGIRIASGFASAGDVFNAYVDAFIIGTASSTSAYNFELGSCGAQVVTRTWTATDSCGNTSSCTQTITVVDTTNPQFVTFPSNISVNADAGLCSASVTLTPPTGSDNCGTPTITGVRSDSQPLSAPFPAGVTTTITWTVTDACNNAISQNQTVTVSSSNEILVSVELQGLSPAPISRCITFQVFSCTSTPVTVSQVLTFTNGKALNASILVPCGSYSCITARDKLHTLRRTLTPMPINSGKYIADYITANKPLLGGNLNDDGFVDILDFGVYAGQYSVNYGTPNTTCSTAFPHADISGDGIVFTQDFTFIQINFLKAREANCCGAPLLVSGSGGLKSIKVEELKARGLADLAVADVNIDGTLDEKDIADWVLGARPGKPLPKPTVRKR